MKIEKLEAMNSLASERITTLEEDLKKLQDFIGPFREHHNKVLAERDALQKERDLLERKFEFVKTLVNARPDELDELIDAEMGLK